MARFFESKIQLQVKIIYVSCFILVSLIARVSKQASFFRATGRWLLYAGNFKLYMAAYYISLGLGCVLLKQIFRNFHLDMSELCVARPILQFRVIHYTLRSLQLGFKFMK